MSFELDIDTGFEPCPRDPAECEKNLEWDFADMTRLFCHKCGKAWSLPFDPAKATVSPP